MGPNRAPKRLRVPYIEDLYPSRKDRNLVDDKLLAQLQNLKPSKTFKGENTSETLPEREGGVSPLATNSSKTLERNDEMDL